MLDLLCIAVVVLALWGIGKVDKGTYNKEYLSVNAGKYYRGLLSVVVILHHLAQRTEGGSVFRLYEAVGFLAVAYFFFVSGYGLQKSYLVKKDQYRKGFLVRRLPVVVIPYLLCALLYEVMYGIGGHWYSVGELFNYRSSVEPLIYFSWYIVAILVFYVGYWVIMNCFGKRMVLGGVLWWLGYVIVCMVLRYGTWWYNTTHLFVLGMYWVVKEDRITEWVHQRYWKVAPVVWVIGSVLFTCNIFAWVIVRNWFGVLLLNMITAAVFVLGVLLFSMKIRMGNGVLGYLGEISLEMYLVQGILILSLRSDVVYIHNEFVWCVLVIVGTVVLGSVVHAISKRMVTMCRKCIGA